MYLFVLLCVCVGFNDASKVASKYIRYDLCRMYETAVNVSDAYAADVWLYDEGDKFVGSLTYSVYLNSMFVRNEKGDFGVLSEKVRTQIASRLIFYQFMGIRDRLANAVDGVYIAKKIDVRGD